MLPELSRGELLNHAVFVSTMFPVVPCGALLLSSEGFDGGSSLGTVLASS